MAQLNSVRLAGYLCRKPEFWTLSYERKICRFLIGANTQYEIKGKMMREVAFVRVVCHGSTAQYIFENADTGDNVFVEGRIKTERFKSKQAGKKVSTNVVQAMRVEILRKKIWKIQLEEQENQEAIIDEADPLAVKGGADTHPLSFETAD